jgi:hypothetical protein
VKASRVVTFSPEASVVVVDVGVVVVVVVVVVVGGGVDDWAYNPVVRSAAAHKTAEPLRAFFMEFGYM